MKRLLLGPGGGSSVAETGRNLGQVVRGWDILAPTFSLAIAHFINRRKLMERERPSTGYRQYFLRFFLMWTIFKVFIEFASILLLLFTFCFLLLFFFLGHKACGL